MDVPRRALIRRTQPRCSSLVISVPVSGEFPLLRESGLALLLVVNIRGGLNIRHSSLCPGLHPRFRNDVWPWS